MKKVIALAVCASFALSTVGFANDSLVLKQKKVDVVATATTTTPVPAPAPKPAPKPTPAPAPKPAPAPVPKATTVVQPMTPAPVEIPAPAKVDRYEDGVYVAFGNAYAKGTEGAKVTIKDGKIADIELLRTSPKMIDRDARFNYRDLWFAYVPMKESLLGKTREEAQEVDVVAGATRSCDGWKMSVDRAFVKALKVKPADAAYFEGVHMGVDPEGKYMVFASFDKWSLKETKVYPLDAKGSAIEEAAMNEEQKKESEALAKELTARGLLAKPVKGYESKMQAVVKAYFDALLNAKINNDSKYIDGVYSAYGIARDKGVERADIIIRNDKLVDVKLYRLGADLKDRGNTAYPAVVTGNAPMVAKFLAKGKYIENFNDKIDAVAGATESAHSWNLAIERAYEKAAKVPSESKYFNGRFAGVDTQTKFLVLVDVENDQVTKVMTYMFGADKKIIAATALTAEQKELLAKLDAGLLAEGMNLTEIKGHEMHVMTAKYAYADALENASTKQNNYKDGAFVAYGDANDKGNNMASVTLRNGKIVDIKVARIGVNYVDRGETAYPDVVKAIPIVTPKFIEAATREGAQQVDVVAGATSSINEFKVAIERAYNRAEIIETNKVAYQNGTHGGVDKLKSTYVLVKVEKNLPVEVVVYYLDAAGKLKAVDTLTADEKFVKETIETAGLDGAIHKYAYRPAALEKNEAVKAISTKVIEAINAALESAGR